MLTLARRAPRPMKTAQIDDICARLSPEGRVDRTALREVRGQLEELRGELDQASAEQLGCLDAAITMVQSLASLDDATAARVRSMVVRLVELSTRSRPSSTDDAPAAGETTLDDMMLSEVLIELGYVTQAQVDAALEKMMSSAAGMGEVLVESGAAAADDIVQGETLKHLLVRGEADAGGRPQDSSPTSRIQGLLLGEILVRQGVIDRAQLEEGLERQSETGTRIGEALVELGFIDWKDVSRAVGEQHDRGLSLDRNANETIIRLDQN